MSTQETSKRARDSAVLVTLPPETPITLEEAARIATVSLRHLMQERSLGRGPTVYKLGPKTLRTTVADVLEWVRSRPEVRR